MANHNQVAVPLRDPTEIWKSWVARNQLISEMEKAWERLLILDSEFDFIYIPVDIPGVRDNQLSKLNRTWSWTEKLGENEGWKEKPSESPPDFVKRLYSWDFLAEFYSKNF